MKAIDKRQFFEQIFRGGEGRATIVLPNFEGKPTKEYWFQYPEQLDDMVEFAEKHNTGSVWFSPILFDKDQRLKTNAIAVSVAGADADECDPNNFRVQPSISVQTSPGHWHVYWALDKSYDPNEVAKLNRRIAQVHKDEGCDTAFVNAAKLMRVPGTSNHKHPGAVVIVADYDVTVDLPIEAMDELYPVSEVPDAVSAIDTPLPEGLAAYIDANGQALRNGLPNRAGLRDMLFGTYHGDKRSDVLFKLCCELYRMGMSDKDVAAVAWFAPSNKFNGEDNRGIAGLWSTAVVRAKAAVEEENNFYDAPIDDALAGEAGQASKPKASVKKRTVFLTADELETIQGYINFVDEWVTWAGSKTDAPAEYHRAAAITLMSTVYSEFGHATPKFGKLGLNLWFMILGRSTKERKSTARDYLQSAFRALETDDYHYDLGEDVTPSGISLVVHDMPNKSVCFSRDEVQGFFKEIIGQSYMSGGAEALTKLYGGWSGGRVRATGDKKVQKSVPISFLMFMMGILTEATDVLTVTNFRSGFLTRFLYVIGSRPEGYESPELEQSDPNEKGGHDAVFDGLMSHMNHRRNWWEMRGGEGQTYGLRADDDAWDRYKVFMKDMTEAAEDTQYAEIISSTSERTSLSVLKLAALFAMDDMSTTIKLKHMLQAIAYAGEWFDNTVTVASMVSASEWERDVNKLEQLIAGKGGRVTYAQAYRAFPEKKPNEFEMIVEALHGKGVLNRVQAGSRWVLELNYEE